MPLTSAVWLQHTLAATSQTTGDPPADFLTRAYEFVEPYQFFILIIIVLWLVARRPRSKKEDFNKQAQEVLDEKFRNGEITRQAYEKYRQDISLRPKR